MQSGHLQWHFLEVLEQKPAVIHNWLKDAENISILLNKMNKHFRLRSLFALIKSIEPSNYKTIINYQQNLIYSHQKEPFTPVSEKVFSDSLWEMIIHALINRSGSYFNRLSFLKKLIKDIANHYNIDHFALILRLRQIAEKISVKSSSIPDFIQLLKKIFFENANTKDFGKKEMATSGQIMQKGKDKLYNDSNDQALKFEKQRNKKLIKKYFQNKQNG